MTISKNNKRPGSKLGAFCLQDRRSTNWYNKPGGEERIFWLLLHCYILLFTDFGIVDTVELTETTIEWLIVVR